MSRNIFYFFRVSNVAQEPVYYSRWRCFGNAFACAFFCLILGSNAYLWLSEAHPPLGITLGGWGAGFGGVFFGFGFFLFLWGALNGDFKIKRGLTKEELQEQAQREQERAQQEQTRQEQTRREQAAQQEQAWREQADKERADKEQAQQEQAQRERDPQERARRERAQQERAWQRQQQQQREQKQHEKAGQERAQQDSGERDDGGEADGQAWFVVLGVAATASIEEINKAYKTLIGQYHPDKVATLGPKLKLLAGKESKKINAAIKEARRLHAKNM